MERWRKRETRWAVGWGNEGRRGDGGYTSRAQAILRTTQPLGGRTNRVGAQSRATRVEEGGKRLHDYPIQRTYPRTRPSLSSSRLLSLSFALSLSLRRTRARFHRARYVLTATIKDTDALTRATITARTNIFRRGRRSYAFGRETQARRRSSTPTDFSRGGSYARRWSRRSNRDSLFHGFVIEKKEKKKEHKYISSALSKEND